MNIPKQYWLHIDHFDIHSFTYEDVIALQSSPECLLQDFRKNPEFEPTCRAILRAHQTSRRSFGIHLRLKFIKNRFKNVNKLRMIL